MLELSGLSRQEVLVGKACAATKDFEGVAQVLVDQYSGIHVREGSKSWVGRASTLQSGKPGKGYGSPRGSYCGKGLGSYKTAHAAYPDWESMEEGAEGEFEEGMRKMRHTQVCLEESRSLPLNWPSKTPMSLLLHTNFRTTLMSLRPQP